MRKRAGLIVLACLALAVASALAGGDPKFSGGDNSYHDDPGLYYPVWRYIERALLGFPEQVTDDTKLKAREAFDALERRTRIVLLTGLKEDLSPNAAAFRRLGEIAEGSAGKGMIFWIGQYEENDPEALAKPERTCSIECLKKRAQGKRDSAARQLIGERFKEGKLLKFFAALAFLRWAEIELEPEESAAPQGKLTVQKKGLDELPKSFGYHYNYLALRPDADKLHDEGEWDLKRDAVLGVQGENAGAIAALEEIVLHARHYLSPGSGENKGYNRETKAAVNGVKIYGSTLWEHWSRAKRMHQALEAAALKTWEAHRASLHKDAERRDEEAASRKNGLERAQAMAAKFLVIPSKDADPAAELVTPYGTRGSQGARVVGSGKDRGAVLAAIENHRGKIIEMEKHFSLEKLDDAYEKGDIAEFLRIAGRRGELQRQADEDFKAATKDLATEEGRIYAESLAVRPFFLEVDRIAEGIERQLAWTAHHLFATLTADKTLERYQNTKEYKQWPPAEQARLQARAAAAPPRRKALKDGLEAAGVEAWYRDRWSTGALLKSRHAMYVNLALNDSPLLLSKQAEDANNIKRFVENDLREKIGAEKLSRP